jgi:hypothetical protein
MRRRMLFLASGLVGAVLIQAPAQAAQDLSCADFPNQEAAQKEFDRYEADVNDLDRDGDKIACEWISVGGRVFIEDSMEAMVSGRPLGSGVPGLTYGNPSGARAELRSVPPLAGEGLAGGFGSGSQASASQASGSRESASRESASPESAGQEAAGQVSGSQAPEGTVGSSRPAEATPWKSEETQESGEINGPAAGQVPTDAQGPEQVIVDDAADPSAIAADGATQALPHTGPPARDTGLGVMAMSMLMAGLALLKGGAYRPRRLAARR